MDACVSDVIRMVNDVAPEDYAEEWDNVGLQVGDPGATVRHLAVALGITSAVMEQAMTAGVDMLLTHHPLIFQPLGSVRSDDATGRRLMDLVKANMVLYCAHTNLDAVNMGPSGVLAQELDLQDSVPLVPRQDLLKIAVFVPRSELQDVRLSLGRAGAGQIGNYSHCSFVTEGEGTFTPGPGSDPFIGVPGQWTRVEEARVEAILPRHLLSRVLAAVRASHPYEEPTIDVWPLLLDRRSVGMGRIGDLSRPRTYEEVLERVSDLCGSRSLRVAGRLDEISRVAVCGGSGADLWKRALHLGADLYLTGDVSYHVAEDAVASGLVMVDPGHAATEEGCIPVVADYLRERMDRESLDCEVTVLGPVQDPWGGSFRHPGDPLL